jgi:hypothetical protein
LRHDEVAEASAKPPAVKQSESRQHDSEA